MAAPTEPDHHRRIIKKYARRHRSGLFSRCFVENKVIYPSVRDAEACEVELSRAGSEPQTAYQCRHCGGAHLTRSDFRLGGWAR